MSKLTQIARISLAVLMLATFVGTAWPQSARAETAFDTATGRTTLPLCKKGVDPATEQGQALALIPKENKNWLVQIFSKGNLYYRLRCDPLIFGAATSEGNYEIGLYRASLSIVNVLILIVLLVVAFANILRYKIDTYSVKKALVPMVLGIVLANFALPIVWTITDFANVLTVTLINEATREGTLAAFVEALISSVYRQGPTAIGNLLTQSAQGSTIGMITGLVAIFGWGITALGPFLAFIWAASMFLLLMPSILFLGLGIAMIARIYVLLILTACAPLAFASFGFPGVFKSKIWTQWWGYLINWTFMAPITFFWLWLAIQVYRASGSEANIATYLISLTCITMALKTPTNKGGSVMASLNSKVIEPLQKSLKTVTGITPGLTYARQKTPKDVSRFLSSRGLNFAKPIRAVLEGIEEANRDREENSISSRLAKVARPLAKSVNIAKPNLFDLKKTIVAEDRKRYSYAGMQRVNETSLADVKRFGLEQAIANKQHFSELSTDLKRSLEEEIQRRSRLNRFNRLEDPDGLAALALLMSNLGRFHNDTSDNVTSVQQIIDKLKTSGYETDSIDRYTKGAQANHNGIMALQAANPNLGISPDSSASYMRRLMNTPEYQSKEAEYIGRILALLNKMEINIDNLSDDALKRINADAELSGLVATVLNSNIGMSKPVSPKLEFALGRNFSQQVNSFSTDPQVNDALGKLGAMGRVNAADLTALATAGSRGTNAIPTAAAPTKDALVALLGQPNATWSPDLGSQMNLIGSTLQQALNNLAPADYPNLTAEKIYQLAGLTPTDPRYEPALLSLNLALTGIKTLYTELDELIRAGSI